MTSDKEPETCPDCGGTGFSDGCDVATGFCKRCNGSGFVTEG